MEVGDIVVSKAGHDKGKAFIVIATVGAEFVLIVDGKSRKLESPKLKKSRHLRVVEKSDVKSPTNASVVRRIKKFYSERRLYAEE